jgi:hypothetical protein
LPSCLFHSLLGLDRLCLHNCRISHHPFLTKLVLRDGMRGGNRRGRVPQPPTRPGCAMDR